MWVNQDEEAADGGISLEELADRTVSIYPIDFRAYNAVQNRKNKRIICKDSPDLIDQPISEEYVHRRDSHRSGFPQTKNPSFTRDTDLQEGRFSEVLKVMPKDSAEAEVNSLHKLALDRSIRSPRYHYHVPYQDESSNNPKMVISMEQIHGPNFSSVLQALESCKGKVYDDFRMSLFRKVADDTLCMRETLKRESSDDPGYYRQKFSRISDSLWSSCQLPDYGNEGLKERLKSSFESISGLWEKGGFVALDRIPRNIVFDYAGILHDILFRESKMPVEVEFNPHASRFAGDEIHSPGYMPGYDLTDVIKFFTKNLPKLIQESPTVMADLFKKHMYHIDFDTAGRTAPAAYDAVNLGDCLSLDLPDKGREEIKAALGLRDTPQDNLMAAARHLSLWDFYRQKDEFKKDSGIYLRKAYDYLGRVVKDDCPSSAQAAPEDDRSYAMMVMTKLAGLSPKSF